MVIKGLTFIFLVVGSTAKVLCCFFLSYFWLYLRVSTFHPVLPLPKVFSVPRLSLLMPLRPWMPCFCQCHWGHGRYHQYHWDGRCLTWIMSTTISVWRVWGKSQNHRYHHGWGIRVMHFSTTVAIFPVVLDAPAIQGPESNMHLLCCYQIPFWCGRCHCHEYHVCRYHHGSWCLQLQAQLSLLLCSAFTRSSAPTYRCMVVRVFQAFWCAVQKILCWTMDVLLVVTKG